MEETSSGRAPGKAARKDVSFVDKRVFYGAFFSGDDIVHLGG